MTLITVIYNNISDSNKYIRNVKIDKKDYNIDFNGDSKREIELKKKLEADDDLIPREIYIYIINNIKHQRIYRAKLYDKNIIVNIFSIEKVLDLEYDRIINQVLLAFLLLNIQSDKKCSKTLTLDLYLTPFKKTLPEIKNNTEPIVLDSMNVNTGFSTIGCRSFASITIYREEDWLKVLIHELFHNLNLDFAIMNNTWIKEIFLNKLGLRSEYNIYETYCETWARILYVALLSYNIEIEKKIVIKKKAFFDNFDELMIMQQFFSMIQCNKIISLIENSRDYRENTNVLCYYVFTGALINDYKKFMLWCVKNNGDKFMNFTKSLKTVNNFIKLIMKEYNSEEFRETIEVINSMDLSSMGNSFDNSLRMSI